MADITSDTADIVFDGRGFGLVNLVVTHKPLSSVNRAAFSLIGIDANGDESTLVNQYSLMKLDADNQIGQARIDVVQLTIDPMMSLRYIIHNSERMMALLSVKVTTSLPAEVIPNGS
ncbi:MAG: hypothetical protein ACYC3W_12625 [Candidatus Nanopelagicales bacterium]